MKTNEGREFGIKHARGPWPGEYIKYTCICGRGLLQPPECSPV